MSSRNPTHNRTTPRELDNYFPSPNEAFQSQGENTTPRRLICTICFETELKPADNVAGPYRDSDPAVLPCGHVFGWVCLQFWLEARPGKGSCPTCRFPLRHDACGHAVAPAHVTTDSRRRVPETLPQGGIVSGLCVACTNEYADEVRENFRPHLREMVRRETPGMPQDQFDALVEERLWSDFPVREDPW
jgi:hypothetical protein